MLDALADQGFASGVRAAIEEYVIRATPTLVNRLPGAVGGADADRLPGAR
jgi:hypothetical protein